ncbi:MAG: LuxR C-terminal-related transcriptional regulator [Caldilineaceae bacterium]
MSMPILATKLYIPPARPNLVPRPKLIERLDKGRHGKLTLISAPAGFGKTTLVSAWLESLRSTNYALPADTAAGEAFVNRKPVLSEVEVSKSVNQVAWLSLDAGDSEPPRFLAYLVAALQRAFRDDGKGQTSEIGQGIAAALQSPQPPPIQALLTALLNELAALSAPIVLVLDDYHLLNGRTIDDALTFLLEHLPPAFHLVITTREDPNLPLARYRARGQMTEIRAAELRFTADEAAAFLNQALGFKLAPAAVAALEAHTEGWIAGLQLAALSLQGHASGEGGDVDKNRAAFIDAFTGSHRYVMDYLVEEVLAQQPERIQTFMMHTAILDRLCGPLCDALLDSPTAAGQSTLAQLEQANLFLIPLDNERHWYRYHHLFAELLRQRLHQQLATAPNVDPDQTITLLHSRASQWFADHGFELEAFAHAAAGQDLARAMQLAQGDGMPLHFRGAITPVLQWLESLPKAALNTDPALWVMYASVVTMTGQVEASVEEKLQAAEALLPDAAWDDPQLDPKTRDLVGQIAGIRAMLGIPKGQTDLILQQSRRALATLHPHNLPVRTSANWTLGFAHQLQGERAAAMRAYSDTIAISQASGNIMMTLAATICLGQVQEADLHLHLAAEQFGHVLALIGDPPWATACEAYLGLARIYYAWNDLAQAQAHVQQSLPLAQQLPNVDTPASCWLLLARIQAAQGDWATALDSLTRAEAFVQQHNFGRRLAEVTAQRVEFLLQQGAVAEAARLAQEYDLPLTQARVHLAQDNPAAALALLSPLRQQMAERAWRDEHLKVMVLETMALAAQGNREAALERLEDALEIAEASGLIRLFVDEGAPMAALLRAAAARKPRPAYVGKLLAAFEPQPTRAAMAAAPAPSAQALIEPLSERELEVLQLIAEGLSNREIGQRLYIAIDTVKGHNRRIFGKLQVQRRTEAIVRARELGLL